MWSAVGLSWGKPAVGTREAPDRDESGADVVRGLWDLKPTVSPCARRDLKPLRGPSAGFVRGFDGPIRP